MKALIEKLEKVLGQYGYEISSLKNFDDLPSKELAFSIYSECHQDLIALAPKASKRFYNEYDVDILDYFIREIVLEATRNIACIWENMEEIKEVNSELPIFISLDDVDHLERVDKFNEKDKQEIYNFFKENNYELYCLINNNIKYYFLKDLELDIIERNHAVTVVSRNAFEKNLEVLFQKIKKDIEDEEYLFSSCPFTVIQASTERKLVAKSPLEQKVMDIFEQMNCEIIQAEDQNNNTVYLVWNLLLEKYALSVAENMQEVAKQLKEHKVPFEHKNSYFDVFEDFKVINCYSFKSIQDLLDRVVEKFDLDYFGINKSEILNLRKSLSIKQIYAVVKVATDNRFDFSIESDAVFFESYNEALKNYICETLQVSSEYKMQVDKEICTKEDADNVWEQILYKYSSLEYYLNLVTLEIK